MCDELDCAKIALEEYKVLHAELLQRNNILTQHCGACIAAIVTIIGLIAVGRIPMQYGVVMGLFAVAWMLVIFQVVDSDARKACERIVEIEEYVNKAVGGDDRNPLSWERRFGILSRGYLSRL